MIKLDKSQKFLTKSLSNRKIQTINDFCDCLFLPLTLNSNSEENNNYTNIMIYSDRNYAFEQSKAFRFLIQYYIENRYIRTEENLSLPKLKPFWDYDTRYCHKNKTVFSELNDSCKKYSQKKFIVHKPIRLKILALFGGLPELKDFKTIISKIFIPFKIALSFLRRHLKLTIIIGLLSLILSLIKWIFPNYKDFFKIIEKIFY